MIRLPTVSGYARTAYTLIRCYIGQLSGGLSARVQLQHWDMCGDAFILTRCWSHWQWCEGTT